MDLRLKVRSPNYTFGPFSINSLDRVLIREGQPVSLIPRAIDVLLVLLAARGRTVDKETLLKTAWPETFVEEANIAQNVALLRKALGDSPDQHRYIETIPKRGYRFAIPVHEASTDTAVNSIAVLPFMDMSRQPDQQYFSDGLTEELTHALTGVQGLRVAARTSAFQFKGTHIDIRTIGDHLAVSNVLEGSVRNDAGRLRITVQLIDAATGYHLWSECYDRKMDDIFTVQQEIAHAVASTLNLKFAAHEDTSSARAYTSDLEAYHLYLRGRYFRNKVTRNGFQKSIELYEQVIARDPHYAPAYAGLAESYCNLGWNYNMMRPREAYPRAIAAANKALSLDDTLPDAHVSLGLIKLNYEWDWPGAEQAFRRAIWLNPSNVNAHHRYSHYLMAMNRVDESLAESLRSIELDPLDLTISHHLGWHYRLARQHDEAISQLRKTLELDQNQEMTHVYLGQTYLQKDMHAEAILEFQRAAELGNDERDHLTWLGYAHAVSGHHDEALQMLDRLMRHVGNDAHVSAYSIALLHAGLHNTEHALKWLESAYEERNPFLVYLDVEPDWDDLRAEPGFLSVLTKMGLV